MARGTVESSRADREAAQAHTTVEAAVPGLCRTVKADGRDDLIVE